MSFNLSLSDISADRGFLPMKNCSRESLYLYKHSTHLGNCDPTDVNRGTVSDFGLVFRIESCTCFEKSGYFATSDKMGYLLHVWHFHLVFFKCLTSNL